MEQILFNQEDVFFRPLFSDHIRIFKVDTHTIEGKKKVKLDKPVYHIEYLLNFKKPFTTYSKDINYMVAFGRWIKQPE